MTYEYECDAGHEFEAAQRISEEPLAECPVRISHDHVCLAPCRRVVRTPRAFRLKGTGWAKDGYGQEL